jgi:hypothetical protein
MRLALRRGKWDKRWSERKIPDCYRGIKLAGQQGSEAAGQSLRMLKLAYS